MYFDLEYEIRKNPDYRRRLQQKLQELSLVMGAAKKDPSQVTSGHKKLMETLELTKFNTVLLTPYAWPAFPKKNPLYYSDYPFAFQFFRLQTGGYKVFKGSRQISKSTSIAARQILNSRIFAGIRSLYIAPHNVQLETYQTKFRELERSCRWYQKYPHLRQNLGLKEFPNGSVIEMAYVLTSAHAIRGKTTDDVIIDEMQHFDPDLELEVLQIQSASETPSTIFAGTSLTTDSALEEKWLHSSQGLWVMTCANCGHHNVPIPEYNVMDMIRPEGCCCAKCKRLLNVKDGRYEHHDQMALRAGREGYHIPQIIVPAVIYNQSRWAEIYNLKMRLGASRAFFQEILGIATEEGEKEITKKQLQAMCVLGNDIDKLHQKAVRREYRWVVSGCDWGGSDYNPQMKTKASTTVHCVLGVCPDGKLDILHFRRYGGMKYDDISDDIVRNHKALTGYALAADTGVGAVYNNRIRELIPVERHLLFTYTGPTADLISEPKGPHMYNHWSLNKTESISLTFQAIREGRIRCYDWELAQEYLMDFLNLFRAPGERAGTGAGSGATTFLYRGHPSKTNDALMALNYAHMLAKIMIGEPMFADLATQTRLLSCLSSDLTGIHIYSLPGAYSG
jgi:hypothetical protein